MHVDINSIPIHGTLPIKITLMSARAGQPVCMSVVSIELVSGSAAPVVSARPSNSTAVAPTHAPAVISSGMVNTSSLGKGPASGKAPTSSMSESIGSTSAVSGVSVVGMMQNPFRNICAAHGGAYRLWLVLLVLYALLVAVILWIELPAPWSWPRTPEWLVVEIIIPLILLLAFWYFSVGCRAAWWMPVVAALIALAGLFAAFWEHPRPRQLLLIEN